MPRYFKTDPRQARLRRETALARAELRGDSQPRKPAAGVTSFAVKVDDPADRQRISEFLEQRGQA